MAKLNFGKLNRRPRIGVVSLRFDIFASKHPSDRKKRVEYEQDAKARRRYFLIADRAKKLFG